LLTVTNCILWGDTPDEISVHGTAPAVTFSDVQGGYAGTGNIADDPAFVDAVNGDFHLSTGSQCIDVGDNGAPNLPPYDFEGDDRILDGDGIGLVIVDMGADEAPERPPPVVYVDQEATGTNDGRSWANAFTELESALSWAVSGIEIWVAEGTYLPTMEYGGTGDQYRSFQMKNGVAVYGGFDPSDGATAWEDRDWDVHPAILSGDIGTPGDNADNSYHLFYHPAGTNLDGSAILDGFTVSGGNANGGDSPDNLGGGMYNDASSPALSHVHF
jgi:hypothetical protein